MPASHNPLSVACVPDQAGAPDGGFAIERVAPRTPASLTTIEGVRLLPMGMDASLVNISTRGALILCCRKLCAGMVVRVVFAGASVPAPVGAKVVRSLVSQIGPGGELWYHVGIAFDQPIELAAPVVRQSAEESSAQRRFVNRW